MAVTFWFKLSEMFNIALYSVHTQPGELVLKLLLLNGHQNLSMETGSDPKCDTFDGKNSDK